MIFRRFKGLTAAPKTKACSRDYELTGSTWTYSPADIGRVKRIMVFGDSNASRPDGNRTCWPALIEDKGPLNINVFNESCDGRTTKYDIGERNGLSVIASKLTIHAPLDYVIVMLGTNDVKIRYGPPNAAEIANGIRQVIDFIDVHGGGAKPILLTPPPMGNVISGDLAGGQSRIPPVAAEFRLLAINSDVPLVDVNTAIDSDTDLEPDKVHLNLTGRQKVADTIWASLQGLTAPVR
ncbi:MAG: hypothetical protein IME93_07445 [Proteobacteria bacterium]|nr:hypothetical protein [Pseudomonadota bacterium]